MFDPISPDVATTTSRAVQLALAAVIALAVVGYVVGIRQGVPSPEVHAPVPSPGSATPSSLPATSYADFDSRRLGPNCDWRSQLSDLVPPDAGLSPNGQTPASSGERTEYLASRSARRAFDGAPPVVPHPIDQMGTSSCLVCHERGAYIGKNVWAPAMSHPKYASCTQCHAEGASTEFAWTALAANEFQGRGPAGLGSRAGEGAPPTIPHTTWMRENCLSCHGKQGANPIRTSHPYRASCTQCHAPSAALDQVFPQPRSARPTGSRTP